MIADEKYRMLKQNKNLISVILPTLNRAELLKSALDSFTRQILEAEQFEVLVIDNGSTDHTLEVVNSFSESLPNLSYYHEPEPGLHNGRHRGLKEAGGDFLVYADDDIEAFPTWLSSIAESFKSPDVVMVGGNNLPMFINEPPGWLQRMWDSSELEGGKAIPSLSVIELPGVMREFSPSYVWGCNFAIKKSVLLAAGGFNPDGMPKELIRFRGDGETHVSNYVANSKLKCLFHPGASVHHKVTPGRMTAGYFRQRGFNQGVSDSFTALRASHVKNKSFQAHHGFGYRFVRWFYRKSKVWRIRDVEIRRITKAMAAGYAEGFTFHQRLFNTDSEVRAWVLKENYL